MSKYALFGSLVLYLVLVTFLIEASAVYSIENGLETTVSSTDSASALGVFNMLGVFFRLLIFNVSGFPVWASMIFIYPVVFVFWFMILDILKDLIPFT